MAKNDDLEAGQLVGVLLAQLYANGSDLVSSTVFIGQTIGDLPLEAQVKVLSLTAQAAVQLAVLRADPAHAGSLYFNDREVEHLETVFDFAAIQAAEGDL